MAVGPHTRIIAALYRRILKPILFAFDPENVHDQFVNIGELLGDNAATRLITRAMFYFSHPSLATTVAGIRFENPVGLGAGFDKNARLCGILPDVGFGFAELGSFTGKPCAGNPRPRLWRLPKSKALAVYYGLKNDGADAISERMRSAQMRFPVGISAAKTNNKETADPDVAITDYCHVIDRFRGIGDYFAVNISCPNAFGGETFTHPDLLDRLLTAVDARADKPVFLKLAADLSEHQLDEILRACANHRVDGFICSNLAKSRANPAIIDANVPAVGGISGKPAQSLSDEQIRYLYRKTRGKYSIIGVGGIFNAEDAYRKIRLGASLVQLITGMIYEGPQLIGQINRDLVRLLRRDGFRTIGEAVGAENRG